MKKFFNCLLALSIVCLISSCSKDNPEEDNIDRKDAYVVVNEDGTTSNGSIFSAIDDKQ